MGCSVLCEQQRSSCSAFRYLFVQRKGKTTYRNTTLIPISLRCNPLSSNFFLQGLILFLIAPFQLSFSSLGFVSQLPLQAADIGKALQFLRKVIFVQDRVSTVLHHFQRHGPKDRGKLIDAFRSGERESSVIKNPNNWAGYQLPHQHNWQKPSLLHLEVFQPCWLLINKKRASLQRELKRSWCSLIYPFNHRDEQGDAGSSTCAHGGQSFPSPSPQNSSHS